MSNEGRLGKGLWWRLGLVAALAMSFLALWPQIYFWTTMGADWQGSYVKGNYDEEVYAAYINGLIEGRPRRSDPLIELQNGELPPESIFSIQFPQPMLLAFVGRSLGISASTIFIILCPVLAFLSTLAIFGLLYHLFGDQRIAATGALFVLCLGSLAGWGGKIITALGFGYTWSGFPFLRRYQPGLTFPLLFVFIFLVWYTLTRDDRRGWLASSAAGVVFAILVFSYFFTWTVAAAWVVIIVALWLAARPEGWRTSLKRLLPFFLVASAAIFTYALFLSNIVETTSRAQILEYTRETDFSRFPEYISAVVLVLIFQSVRTKKIKWADPLTLLVLSFALLPFALFNQQVVTGLSLQPVHYQNLYGNYFALFALFLAIFVFYFRSEIGSRSRALAVVGIVSLAVGAIEANYDSRKHRDHNRKRDDVAAVGEHLRQEAIKTGRDPNDREVVFAFDKGMFAADNLATYAPQAILWGMHTSVMPSLSESELIERYYLYLYLAGVSPRELEKRLYRNDFFEVMSVFGWHRSVAGLTTNHISLSDQEIEAAIAAYSQFSAGIDASRAYRPMLSWAVIPVDSVADLSNLERWYLKGPEERVNGYRLFRLSPRTDVTNSPTGIP